MAYNLEQFAILSAHFGDIFWIDELLRRISQHTPLEMVGEIHVIDQMRDPAVADHIARNSLSPQVHAFPIDGIQQSLVGHDHPAALNRSRSLVYAATHIILFDSDCFPVSSDWMEKVTSQLSVCDAIIARDPGRHGLSHPCFMVIPVSAFRNVDFAEGLFEVGLDTGRLVGLQLRRMGLDVHWAAHQPAFSGYRGHFYLDGTIYHHGSASFISSGSGMLRSQVNRRIESFYRARVERNVFRLGVAEKLYVRLVERIASLSRPS